MSKPYVKTTGTVQRRLKRERGTYLHVSKKLVRVPDPVIPNQTQVVAAPRGLSYRRGA